LPEIGSFLGLLTVEENVGMPENYRFMMGFEYQEKRRKSTIVAEIHSL
jgi:hypothetical protein